MALPLPSSQAPSVTPGITACVLLYGDHLELAARCLNQLLTPDYPDLPVIIGTNGCSFETMLYVDELRKRYPEQVAVVTSNTNIHKYPMMRKMFYGPGSAIRTSHVAWFDDDSYLTKPVDDWVRHVRSRFGKFDIMGSIYMQQLQGCQADWIEDQPWYRGHSVRPVTTAKQRVAGQRAKPFSVRFATGGYWVADMRPLRVYDWPWPALDHNGGDVMLGELCRQQNLRLIHDKYGVAINADRDGNESKAERRGYTSKPIGFGYSRSTAAKVLDRNVVGRQMDVEPPTSPTVSTSPVVVKPKPFELEL